MLVLARGAFFYYGCHLLSKAVQVPAEALSELLRAQTCSQGFQRCAIGCIPTRSSSSPSALLLLAWKGTHLHALAMAPKQNGD